MDTLREQFARWLRTYKLNEAEGHEPDCITPWDECSPETRARWLADADIALALKPSSDQTPRTSNHDPDVELLPHPQPTPHSLEDCKLTDLRDLLIKTFASTVEWGAMCENCCSALGSDEKGRVECEMSKVPLTEDEYCPQQISCIDGVIPKLQSFITAKCDEARKEGYKLGVKHQYEAQQMDESAEIAKLMQEIESKNELIRRLTEKCDAERAQGRKERNESSNLRPRQHRRADL